MSPPTSQSYFPQDQTPKYSQQDEIRQNVENLPPRALDRDIGNTHQITIPDTLPRPGQTNGTGQTPARRIIQNGLPNLADRHILEAAIAARRLGGTRGMDRAGCSGLEGKAAGWQPGRHAPPPTERQFKVKGKKAHQRSDGNSPDRRQTSRFYYVGTLEDLKGARSPAAGGKVYIVEGEFDVWSLHTPGHP